MLDIDDAWAAYQLDSTVAMFGTVIENAANERENAGSRNEPDWQPKYTMDQLLDSTFRLPRPKTREDREREAVRTFAGLPGVRRVKARAKNGGAG